MRHVGDAERRTRLARRHAIAPAHRVADVEAATRAMTVLHATEAASVHLAAVARVDGLTVADVDRALYEDRTLVKQLSMRRTVFVVPRDLLPAVLGSASARVAEQEQRRIAKELERGGLTEDGTAWLDRAGNAVASHLAKVGGLAAQQVREQVPEAQGRLVMAPGTKWGRETPVAPWVLSLLGLRGQVVRGDNAGHWRVSRPIWTTMADWLGATPEPLPPDEGYAELVRRWLWTFGPGTTGDIQWWLGSTKAAVTRALARLGAIEVSLDGGTSGWLLPDDVEPEPPVEPWAALLPALDPTTMGWMARGFYLDPADAPYIFDTAGNAGTTAWWDGRVVGCWVQDDDAVVEVVLRRDPGPAARRALDAQAARLTDWLAGVRHTSVYAAHQRDTRPLP